MTVLLSRGYHFDAVNDYIALPAAEALGGAAFTAEGWARFVTSGYGGPIVGAWAANLGWMLYVTNGQVQGYLGNTGPSAGSVPAGRWVHLAMTYDGVTVTVYVDGIAAAAGARAASVPSTGSGAIGAYGNPPPRPALTDNVGGTVRDVRLWSRVLAPAELGVFRPNLRGDEAGLVGWWPLEGDTLDRTVRRRFGPIRDGFGVGQGGPLFGRTTEVGGATWVIGGPGSGLWRVGDGVAQLAAPGGDDEAVVPFPHRNVEVRALIRRQTIGTGGPGLIARTTIGAAADSYVMVHLSAPNAFTVYKRVAGSYVAQGITPIPDTNGAARDVRLRAIGTTVQAIVDGVVSPVYSVFDAAVQLAGGVGLYSNATGLDQWWDNFEVTALDADDGLHGIARNGARPALARSAA